MPRLDYSNGSCPSLLLEPSRTNLITYSEYFGAFPWNFSTGAMNLVENNSIISPEGFKNATKIERTGTRTYTTTYVALDATLGATYTLSAYMKSGTHDIGLLSFVLFGSIAYSASYDLTNGETNSLEGDAISSMESVGDGWWRCVLSGFTPPDSDLSGRAQIGMSYTSSVTNWSPSDGGAGLYMYYYGVQLEQDATYPTSYIPTYGVSQTRLADVCLGAGDVSTFNSTEGVLYAEFNAFADDRGSSGYFQISDGTGSNRFYIGNSGAVDSKFSSAGVIGGSLQWNINSTSNFDVTQFHKIALSYKENDITLYVDGQIQGTDTSASIPPANTFNVLDFRASTTTYRYGEVKQVAYFPTALSDEACIELTTI